MPARPRARSMPSASKRSRHACRWPRIGAKKGGSDIGRHQQQALQEDRAGVDFDAALLEAGQVAAVQQALVQQADWQLDHVDLEVCQQRVDLAGVVHRHARSFRPARPPSWPPCAPSAVRRQVPIRSSALCTSSPYTESCCSRSSEACSVRSRWSASLRGERRRAETGRLGDHPESLAGAGLAQRGLAVAVGRERCRPGRCHARPPARGSCRLRPAACGRRCSTRHTPARTAPRPARVSSQHLAQRGHDLVLRLIAQAGVHRQADRLARSTLRPAGSRPARSPARGSRAGCAPGCSAR